MPKSKLRKKDGKVIPADILHPVAAPTESPRWLAPVMVGAFLAGLVWIVIFYVTSTNYPVPGIGAWNMVIGFGFVGVGFTLATKWR
ncbi:MAG: cell division protein CrgA [Actinobacteria bacterium]|nr:cell division protein CrgA [Actinomycetota bacterium]